MLRESLPLESEVKYQGSSSALPSPLNLREDFLFETWSGDEDRPALSAWEADTLPLVTPARSKDAAEVEDENFYFSIVYQIIPRPCDFRIFNYFPNRPAPALARVT